MAAEEPHGDQARGVFRPGKPTLRVDRILRLQGYRTLEKVRPVVRRAADIAAERAEAAIRPEVHYCRSAIRSTDAGALALADGVVFSCPAFERLLARAHAVVVVIVTMGAALDEELAASAERKDAQPLDQLFLETCGWLAVEQTTKQFGAFYKGLVRPQGERITSRLAPGYSYRVGGRTVAWPLEQQHQVFQMFSGVDLPVRLLESAAMLPKMSRTGMYGIVRGAG